MKVPTSDEVRAARAAAGITQQRSAEMVYQASSSNWRAYESGRIKMHPCAWELYLLKTNQHPTLQLAPRP